MDILHKRSTVPGKIPGKSSLKPGEIAINIPDKKLYSTEVDGTIFEIGEDKLGKDDSVFLGTSEVPLNRESGELNLEGVNVTGSAGRLVNNLTLNVNGVLAGQFNGSEEKILEINSGNVGYEDQEEIVGVEETLITDALRKTAQILSPEEQTQVQKNIGVDKLIGDINTILDSINGELI